MNFKELHVSCRKRGKYRTVEKQFFLVFKTTIHYFGVFPPVFIVFKVGTHIIYEIFILPFSFTTKLPETLIHNDEP